jgi:DNA polymerase III epsilon subunit-like protein
MSDLHKVIVVDLEMSGLTPGTHGILSIGAVRLMHDEEYYSELRLDPMQTFSPKALEINGFSEQDCFDQSKPGQKEGVKAFYDWVEKQRKNFYGDLAILAGHNVHCDMSFLKNVKDSWPFKYRILDAHGLALGKYGLSLSSEELCDYLRVERENKVHNALEGAKMAKRLLRRMIDFQ